MTVIKGKQENKMTAMFFCCKKRVLDHAVDSRMKLNILDISPISVLYSTFILGEPTRSTNLQEFKYIDMKRVPRGSLRSYCGLT